MRIIRARNFRACSPIFVMAFRNSIGFIGQSVHASVLYFTRLGHAPGQTRLCQMARGVIATALPKQILGGFLLPAFSLQRMLSHNKSLQPTALRAAAELQRWASTEHGMSR